VNKKKQKQKDCWNKLLAGRWKIGRWFLVLMPPRAPDLLREFISRAGGT
jgi:hypothetical protein